MPFFVVSHFPGFNPGWDCVDRESSATLPIGFNQCGRCILATDDDLFHVMVNDPTA